MMEIHQIKQKIDLFNQEKCPTCGASFQSEQYNTIREQLNTLYNEKQNIDEQFKQ